MIKDNAIHWYKLTIRIFLLVMTTSFFVATGFLLLPHLDMQGNFQAVFLSILIAVPILILLHEFLIPFADTITNRFFPLSRTEAACDLEKASIHFLGMLEIKKLGNLMVNTIAEVLGQRVAVLVLYDEGAKHHHVASSYGLPLTWLRKVNLDSSSPLMQYIQNSEDLIERERLLQQFSWPEVYEFSKEFESLAVSWILPIRREDKYLGFIGMSGPVNGEPVPEHLGRKLEETARVCGIAIRNAEQYTELLENYTQLRAFEAQLIQRSKLDAVSELAQGLAHEIHNPLAIISGKAQLLLLKKGQKMEEKALEEVLKTIVKQTERAADITRKLLVFSEHSSSVAEVINFDTIVADTLALISYQMTLEEVSIGRRIAPDLPVFRGQVSEIREILLNLTLNAIQSVKRGGRVEIYVEPSATHDAVVLRVRDTGRGVPLEIREKLFNPFFSTREGGLGLGLFITQQIVYRYHGKIQLDSAPGSGTVVEVYLPVEKEVVTMKGTAYPLVSKP